MVIQFMLNLKILYILKVFIIIIISISHNRGIFDKYLLVIKNKFAKYTNNYYKNEADKKRALRKGKKYFKMCVANILKNKKIFNKVINPLVSVVIPVYNAEFKIRKTIRSIQNQNTTNLEIILINDFSTDKTIDVIKSLQKDDERIVLLENKKNNGIFYTRCIGTLKSSGKFIFPLDNDDLFFDEDVIDSIVKEASRGKFDIVEFMYSEYYKLNVPPNKLISTEYGNHTHNLILTQPELGQFPRKKNNTYGVYDSFVWAKCIKSKIYKESINKIGEKLYSKRILRGEDYIMTFVLFRIANNFKYFAKYGIFRFKNIITATYQSSQDLYLLSRIIYLDVIIKFTKKNIDDKMYIVYFCNQFLPMLKKEFKILNNDNQIYFKKVFHKLLKDNYIKKEYKNKFISLFQDMDFELK